MTVPALDAPASAPATEGITPGETEAPSTPAPGTDTEAAPQTDPTPQESDADDDPSPDDGEKPADEPDADAEARRLRDEALEADRARWIEEGKRERERELREAAKTKELEQKVTVAREKFPAALEEYNGLVAKLNIPTDVAEQLLTPIKAFNLDAQEVFNEIAYQDLADTLLSKVPADRQEEFLTKVDKQGLDAWVSEFTEARAPETEAYKKLQQDHEEALRTLTLEDALARSPALKAEVAKLKSEQYDAGREQGRKDPPREGRRDESPVEAGSYESWLAMKPHERTALGKEHNDRMLQERMRRATITRS